jgi:phosphoribosylanthranilate isomerase
MKIQHRDDAEVHLREYGTLTLLAGSTPGQMRTRNADLKIITVEPGLATSHHFHLLRESLFHILSGELMLRSSVLPGEVRVRAGDTVLIDAGEDHRFVNASAAPATLIEIESPPHSGADKIPFGAAVRQCSRPIGPFWSTATGQGPGLKICGVRSLDAAFACWELGIEAIGIHAVGQSWMRAAAFESWMPAVPEELSVFLLTDLTQPLLVGELLHRLRCDTLQLQGNKPAEEIIEAARAVRGAGFKVVKSLQVPTVVEEAAFLALCGRIAPWVDAVLLDSAWRGGTGTEPDWTVVERLVPDLPLPVIIAGGIGQHNIAGLAASVKPLGIDVESSVEQRLIAGGKRLSVKSPARLRELVVALRDSRVVG